jgi:hypothetical protein
MMLFNVIILLIAILILYDFNKGFWAVLCAKIAIPSMVRLVLGGFSMNYSDFLLLVLIASFLIHRKFKESVFPKAIGYILFLQIISTFILILLSPGNIVPLSYQWHSFLKDLLFQQTTFLVLGVYALKSKNITEMQICVFFVMACLCGIYGIVCYFLKQNILNDMLTLVYLDETSTYQALYEEARGLLLGRTSGTKSHPLEWGEICGIILGFYYMIKNQVRIPLILRASLIIIILLNIVFTGSRAALIFGILVFIPNLLTIMKKKIVIYGLVGLALLPLIILTNEERLGPFISYVESGVFFWNEKYSDRVNITGSSVSMRQDQFSSSLNIAIRNPVGVGYNYQMYSLEHDFAIADLYGLESVVFKLLVEQGIFALVIFLFIYFKYYKYNIIQNCQDNKISMRLYFVGYLICILITGIQGISWQLFFLLPLVDCHGIEKDDSSEELPNS